MGVCCCLQTFKSVVYMLVMGLVLGQGLMVISIMYKYEKSFLQNEEGYRDGRL